MEVLQQLQQALARTWELLQLDALAGRIQDLEAHTSAPDFWSNPQDAQKIQKELSGLQKEYAQWNDLRVGVSDALDMWQAASADGDEGMLADLTTQTAEFQKQYEDLQQFVLLADEYDSRDAIVSFHAGAGGVDAQDWAEMLLRMITKYAEIHEWTVEILELSRGAEAGIKSATMKITGRYAYGLLRSEHGTHRLVRISPFDAEAMRHTSFANIEVIPDFGDVEDFDIPESEIRIDVFRSGGKGGQGVNTTDSAVRIVHIPTGITVVCQNERSQHQNKAQAMAVLKSKLYAVRVREQEAVTSAERGEIKSAEWGNQIRSYVLQPYKLVKDHRTNHESKQPDDVLAGELDDFVKAYLEWKQQQ